MVLVVMTACHQNISRRTDACADYPNGVCPTADADSQNPAQAKTEDEGSAAAEPAGSAMRARIATSLDLSVEDENKSTLLHHAARRKKNTATMKFLLAQGIIDINKKNEPGKNTALHLAAARGDYGGVELLLKQPGIDKSLKNENGHTAYDIAVRAKRTLIADLLAP